MSYNNINWGDPLSTLDPNFISGVQAMYDKVSQLTIFGTNRNILFSDECSNSSSNFTQTAKYLKDTSSYLYSAPQYGLDGLMVEEAATNLVTDPIECSWAGSAGSTNPPINGFNYAEVVTSASSSVTTVVSTTYVLSFYWRGTAPTCNLGTLTVLDYQLGTGTDIWYRYVTSFVAAGTTTNFTITGTGDLGCCQIEENTLSSFTVGSRTADTQAATVKVPLPSFHVCFSFNLNLLYPVVCPVDRPIMRLGYLSISIPANETFFRLTRDATDLDGVSGGISSFQYIMVKCTPTGAYIVVNGKLNSDGASILTTTDDQLELYNGMFSELKVWMEV